MADELSATVTILRKRDGEDGIVAECLVRKLAEEEFNEIRVAVVGNVDSGKVVGVRLLMSGTPNARVGKGAWSRFPPPPQPIIPPLTRAHTTQASRPCSVC